MSRFARLARQTFALEFQVESPAYLEAASETIVSSVSVSRSDAAVGSQETPAAERREAVADFGVETERRVEAVGVSAGYAPFPQMLNSARRLAVGRKHAERKPPPVGAPVVPDRASYSPVLRLSLVRQQSAAVHLRRKTPHRGNS